MARAKKESKGRDKMDNVSNAAKTLLANIRFMSVDNPIRTIVVTSAIPNEGKTFVTCNLAWAMATSGKRTLIVDCDMRRRSMASQLQVHAQHGLYAVMSGEVELKDAAVPTKTSRLFFLDAEPHIPNPSDLLNARRFTQLIEQMKQEFDYVVFDTPPVGTFVDAAVLGAKVDAVLMVVRERYTHRDEVIRATEQLRTANVPLSGVVMNFCERQSSEYYYEYYYKEGAAGRERRRRRSDSYALSSPADHYGPSVNPGNRRVEDVAMQWTNGQQQRVNSGAVPQYRPAQPQYDADVQRTMVGARPQSWNNAPDILLEMDARQPEVAGPVEETSFIPRENIARRAPEQAARHAEQ